MTFDLNDESCISLSLTEPWKTAESMTNMSQAQPSEVMSPLGQPVAAERLHIGSKNKTATTASLSGDKKQAHDCEALALSVLHSLHYSPNDTTCKEPHTCSAPNDMVPASSKPPCAMLSIDTVLSANQAALTKLTPLIKCSCARVPHIALLHSTILFKAIFWYRAAVSGRDHVEGVELRPMIIQLGILDLDDDDKKALQRSVLLREVRKAEVVVESFQACSPRDDQVPNCHTLAARKMQEELHAIIQEIKRPQSEI